MTQKQIQNDERREIVRRMLQGGPEIIDEYEDIARTVRSAIENGRRMREAEPWRSYRSDEEVAFFILDIADDTGNKPAGPIRLRCRR